MRVKWQDRGAGDPELVWGSVLGLAGVWVWVWVQLGFPVPGCGFRGVTGWPCLTCGATRVVRALVAGEVVGAMWLNPLVTVGLVGAGLYVVYAAVVVVGRTKRLRVEIESGEEAKRVRWVVGLGVVLNWVYVAGLAG